MKGFTLNTSTLMRCLLYRTGPGLLGLWLAKVVRVGRSVRALTPILGHAG